MIKKRFDEGNNCIINWYYEEDDEAILSLGEHFKSTIKIPFNLIEFIYVFCCEVDRLGE